MNNIADDLKNAFEAGFRAGSLRWIKTADRLPTADDAGYNEEVIALYRYDGTEVVGGDYWLFVARSPQYFPYWMPIPPLPEVEG